MLISRVTLIPEINECDSNPCNNDGYCYDRENYYRCSCQGGFIGTDCDEGMYQEIAYYHIIGAVPEAGIKGMEK